MLNPIAPSSPLESTTLAPLLEVKDLRMHFPIRHGLFGQVNGYIKAADGVSFAIKPGETLGLVGESGCGKSTIGRCIVRAYDITSGQMLYRQENGAVIDLARIKGEELRSQRRAIRMIFQDPYSSLNPRMTVFDNISEALHNSHTMSHDQIRERVAYLLKRVGLRPEYMTRYPHAFSGGERQRIVVARALVTNPRLIVADEAVSALDVSIRAQILNLLEELQAEFNLTYLFISHDLSVIRHLCDRVAVMYVGKLVETGGIDDLYSKPKHPYTEALLSSVPIANPRHRGDRARIQLTGDIADPSHPPSGCYFHPRCAHTQDVCRADEPPLVQIAGEGADVHLAACHFANALSLTGVPEE